MSDLYLSSNPEGDNIFDELDFDQFLPCHNHFNVFHPDPVLCMRESEWAADCWISAPNDSLKETHHQAFNYN
jgi:hypothetical protein